jgi:hypothetical protein
MRTQEMIPKNRQGLFEKIGVTGCHGVTSGVPALARSEKRHDEKRG